MAELIIIRAGQNSGKTTTTGLVYQELLTHSEKAHTFDGENVDKDSLRFSKEGNTYDFTAILTINNKKVGIISAGDVASQTQERISIFININIDVIICCARSVNRKGSTYIMILDKFSKVHPIALEIFTKYSDQKGQKNEIKKPVVEKIVKATLDIVYR